MRTYTEEELQKAKDHSYLQGKRMQSLQIMQALEIEGKGDVMERQETIIALRSICEEFGDNDWEDDLHMADILNKHLLPYLSED